MSLRVITGPRAVAALIKHAPERIREVLFEDPERRPELIKQLKQASVSFRQARRKVLQDHADGLRHQGVLALVEAAEYVPWASLISDPAALLLAVDQITDPHNLGAILRSLEAMGGTGALLTSNRCARLGPAVARASAGASELIPVAMEVNLSRALIAARDAGCQIVGADLDGVSSASLDFTVPTVLVIGAEGKGLRRLSRERCDDIATIPLTGATASLNASVAAGILIFTAAEQRRNLTLKLLN